MKPREKGNRNCHCKVNRSGRTMRRMERMLRMNGQVNGQVNDN